MHFTREPVTETIITPKEGFKLVIRNSKCVGQEEFFVDAVEIVSFGHALFFRSLEKPKSFLVPVTDYEILEMRDTRLMVKHVNVDRAIKIAGGRAPKSSAKEGQKESGKQSASSRSKTKESDSGETKVDKDPTLEKKRDRRRHSRKRRTRDESIKESKTLSHEEGSDSSQNTIKQENVSTDIQMKGGDTRDETTVSSSVLSSVIPPPATLISEKLRGYRNYAHAEKPLLSKGLTETSTLDDEGLRAETLVFALNNDADVIGVKSEMIREDESESLNLPADLSDSSDMPHEDTIFDVDVKEDTPASYDEPVIE